MTVSVQRSSVSAEFAHRLVAAASDAAKDQGLAVSIAVVDDAGELKAFLRMDAAYFGSCQLAIDKARSAAAFQLATDKWTSIIERDAVLGRLAAAADRLVPAGGGVPIVVSGTVIGAIGISGGHHTQDVAVAKAALDAALDGQS